MLQHSQTAINKENRLSVSYRVSITQLRPFCKPILPVKGVFFMQSVLLPVHLIGTISERALILYALMLDRAKSSAVRPAFCDADGVPFVIFTVDEVMRTFKIGQCQARATIKELEAVGLIVGKVQGLRQPKHYYIAEVTAEKSAVKTAEKSAVNQSSSNQLNFNQFHQSSGEICENQQTFDDLFLMMTVKDVVAEILCQLVAKNPQEFAEINAEIINFVAENIRNAAENKKIANLTGYARAALRHAQTDYDAQDIQNGNGNGNSGYGATYDIAAYESVSAADSPEWAEGGENYDTFEISTNTGEKQI